MKQNLYYHKFHLPVKVFLIKTAIILLTTCAAFAQTGIKGTVTDATTKEKIPGVTIIVKGTSTMVATDVNGNYSISAPASSTLVFKFLGYAPKEVAVNNQTSINVQLAQEAGQLKDIVVTAMNQNKDRRALGYSVSEVKGASLTEARENSFVNSLEGRVAGVSVSGVATGPNGASNVVIRGLTNLTGNNQPLYVVNGIPLINSNYATTDVGGGYGGKDGGDGIGDINADDIETISILKGASATALYGYRGANGVILITTKKGKSGDGLGVEINSNFVRENVIDETDFQTVYGQGSNGAKPINAADALGSMESSWGAKMDGSLVPQFDGVSRPYTASAKGNLGRFYRPGNNFTNTVSFSKGFGDDGATRFSVSRLNDQNYVPNAGLNRLTFNQTTNLKLGKNLTLDLYSQYVTEYTKNAPNVSDAVGNLNWGPVFLPPNINIRNLAGPNGNGTIAGDSGVELNPFSDPYTTNPYFAAYELQGAIHRNRFTGSANLKYTSDNGYFIGLQVADDYSNDRNTNIEPAGTGYVIDEGFLGDMSDQNVKQTELNIDLTAGKKFKLNKDFSLNLLLGANYRKSTQEFLNTGGFNFAIPFLYTVGNLENPQQSHTINNEEYQSFYGSADFSYKSFLYLTKQQDIYTDLLKEVSQATDSLTEAGDKPTGDILYSQTGDQIAQWKKFGNSLLLRMAMRLTKVDPATAQTYVKKIIADNNTMSSNDDNAIVQHQDGLQLTANRDAIEIFGGDSTDFHLSKTYIDNMQTNGDPRLPVIAWIYSTQDSDPTHQLGMPNGYIVGGNNPAVDITKLDVSLYNPTLGIRGYSTISGNILNTAAPDLILTYAETEFLLADAIKRWGLASPISAQAHYENGVIAAITQLSAYGDGAAISSDDAQTYLDANPYQDATGLAQINTQYWLCTLMDEYEAYANWRRSGDLPALTPVNYPGNVTAGTIPRRLNYPQNQKITNGTNYNAAVARLTGGDKITSRIWWDSQ